MGEGLRGGVTVTLEISCLGLYFLFHSLLHFFFFLSFLPFFPPSLLLILRINSGLNKCWAEFYTYTLSQYCSFPKFVCLFWDKFLLFIPGWVGTHRDLPNPASWILRFKACTITPGSKIIFFIFLMYLYLCLVMWGWVEVFSEARGLTFCRSWSYRWVWFAQHSCWEYNLGLLQEQYLPLSHFSSFSKLFLINSTKDSQSVLYIVKSCCKSLTGK